jgi:hypothetical protein
MRRRCGFWRSAASIPAWRAGPFVSDCKHFGISGMEAELHTLVVTGGSHASESFDDEKGQLLPS